MDRRGFLTGAARAGAGAALFHIVPSWAQGPRPAPSNRIVMGCLGMGGMGMGNLRSFLGQPDVQMVAVCDVDRGRLKTATDAVNSKYGNRDCAAYVDFRDLLGRGDIDAIMTALPDHWHAVPAIMAARAGIDIYGEKPFTHTVAEGRALVDAVRDHQRIWQTGSWQRSQANFRFACELIRNGRIGRIARIEIGLPTGSKCGLVTFGQPPAELDYDLWCGPSPLLPYCKERVHYNWRHQLVYGGGKLMDWVPHHGDIAHWGMGLDESGPVEVEASGDFPTEGIYDAPLTYHVICRYANGAEMHAASSGTEGIKGGCKFIGANGDWVHVDRGKLDASPKSLLQETIGPNETQLYVSTNHHRNFLDGVKTRRPAITPAETAHRSASIGHLGNIAMRLGRKLRWKPETEEFVNDASATALLGQPLRAPWHL